MKKPKRKLQAGKVLFSLALEPELHDKLTDIAFVETEGNLSQLSRRILREYVAAHDAAASGK